MNDIDIISLSNMPARNITHALADLLEDAVKHGASVGFVDTDTFADFCAFWDQEIAEHHAGNQIIICAVDNHTVVGSVVLTFESATNAPHRADVRKLLVKSTHRNQGIATRLLQAVDIVAARHNRTLLVLDTEANTPAAKLYEKLGWQTAGTITRYAALPNGSLADCTFYFKHQDTAGDNHDSAH